MEEIWKDVPGFKGICKVSNNGRIMKKGKIITPFKQTKGYLAISLKSKCHLVHRLVASAFIPNPMNKEQVNHIDGNKENNCVNNLEWCSATENNRHAIETKLRKTPNGKTPRHITQIDKDGNVIRKWENIFEIREKTPYNDLSIFKGCKNRTKVYGYYWKYE